MKNLRRGVCAAFTAALLFAAPAQAQTFSLSSLSSHSSGSSQSGFGSRAVTVDGMVRPYTVVLPRNYNPFKAYPVIIGFGGWQHNAGRTRSYEQLERAAGSRAIVVYPQGMNNAWGGAPYARTSMKSDIRFVRAVVANLGAMHKIDKSASTRRACPTAAASRSRWRATRRISWQVSQGLPAPTTPRR